MALACLAVATTGWLVATLAVEDTRSDGDASPEDAASFVTAAVERLEDASAFQVAFTVHGPSAAEEGLPGEGPGTLLGEGEAVYDSGRDPVFSYAYRGTDGPEVQRYQMRSEQLLMTVAGSGLSVLDAPTRADRYLGTAEFGSAQLRAVLSTSTDLAFAGEREVGPARGEGEAVRGAYLFTGTFTALRGDHGSVAGGGELVFAEGAEFALWIGEEGYPLRLSLRAKDGAGETVEYSDVR
ncbi:hypothetical protein [Nocardiopsis sp. LOL_012]|uniref:hypothetical protein n=1 Tax=Nocardiopsis sp. LOL_012 TaxID=3345409 RepID=UPI003A88BACE